MTTTRLGVLGWPVGHSLSPAIQNAALAAAGLDGWRYQLLPAPPELLSEIVRALAAAGFAGANVTIPHKRAALALATQATDRARAIGAANTLTFGAAGASGGARTIGTDARIGTDATIEADNTDAPALIDALPFAVRNRAALVLGAGGSARAAVWALLDAGAAEVRVWNRSSERALALCDELGATPSASATGPADVLVNCTAVGLDGSDPFPRLPVSAAQLADYGCVVDLVYTPGGSRLVAAAAELGVTTVDGLDLLIGQGALSFERFTGRAAPRGAMRAAVGRVP